MKIILTGCTGFIGSEILRQCIAHHYITHVHVLTRRPLNNEFSHKKVTQHLHEDFETYPPDLLDRLRDEGVEACIFALGGSVSRFRDLDEARRVGVNYPGAAAEAFAASLATALRPYEGYPTAPPKAGHGRFPFRFVFISAAGAEQDQFKKLWVASDARKIKGAAEKAILAAAAHAEEKEKDRVDYKCFEAIALRPGAVLKGHSDDMTTLIAEAVMPSIAVDRLARMAIKCAFDGGPAGKTILENRDCLGEDWASINSLTV